MKPGGGGGGGGANLGVYEHTYVVYACMCSYAKIFYEMHVYLFNIGMLNIGSVMQL